MLYIFLQPLKMDHIFLQPVDMVQFGRLHLIALWQRLTIDGHVILNISFLSVTYFSNICFAILILISLTGTAYSIYTVLGIPFKCEIHYHFG